ncbi:MAG: ABC transporter permease [Saprospiraceae bacterium]|nr:ABC transporter permease [Saprospiraceae bacterium]
MRTILTMVIIALGITALVGILTSIDGILYAMNKNFSSLGANSFSIEKKDKGFKMRQRGMKKLEAPVISYEQSKRFKKAFSEKAMVSISYAAGSSALIKYLENKTNPTIQIRGVDDNYATINGLELTEGRFFSASEQEYGLRKAVLGSDLVKTLFDGKESNALSKIIAINDQKYEVVGVLKSKGASMNEGADKRILIPLERSRIDFAKANPDFDLLVLSPASELTESLISEAIGEMRIIRGLKSYEENNFEINTSDGLISFLKENTTKIRAATIVIALLTLLGAAIGLMNIMLVSVTERTREIGIAKALGATRKNILNLFMTEAILICQIGGIAGILIGIPIGNFVTLLMGGDFLIPWAWILLGFVVCTFVGLFSGLYPAQKASKLDPVESLRFE